MSEVKDVAVPAENLSDLSDSEEAVATRRKAV
jgi:hypothetical protein